MDNDHSMTKGSKVEIAGKSSTIYTSSTGRPYLGAICNVCETGILKEEREGG